MINQETQTPKVFHKEILIESAPSKVWDALTRPERMKEWMSETELNVITDWKVGNSILISGNLHGTSFENTGAVLQFTPEKMLQYSHLSSLSRLSDQPSNYSVLEFKLTSVEDRTILAFTLSNFPTEAIYKHSVFYWNGTLEILKSFIEGH